MSTSTYTDRQIQSASNPWDFPSRWRSFEEGDYLTLTKSNRHGRWTSYVRIVALCPTPTDFGFSYQRADDKVVYSRETEFSKFCIYGRAVKTDRLTRMIVWGQ